MKKNKLVKQLPNNKGCQKPKKGYKIHGTDKVSLYKERNRIRIYGKKAWTARIYIYYKNYYLWKIEVKVKSSYKVITLKKKIYVNKRLRIKLNNWKRYDVLKYDRNKVYVYKRRRSSRMKVYWKKEWETEVWLRSRYENTDYRIILEITKPKPLQASPTPTKIKVWETKEYNLSYENWVRVWVPYKYRNYIEWKIENGKLVLKWKKTYKHEAYILIYDGLRRWKWYRVKVEEDTYKELSKYLTEAFETKVEVKEKWVSIADISTKFKRKIEEVVEKWYSQKHPSRERIEKVINRIDSKILPKIQKTEIKEALEYLKYLLVKKIVWFKEVKYTKEVEKGYVWGYTFKVDNYEKVEEVWINIRYYDEENKKWSKWYKEKLEWNKKWEYNLLIVPDYEKIEIKPYVKVYGEEIEWESGIIQTPVWALRLKKWMSISSAVISWEELGKYVKIGWKYAMRIRKLANLPMTVAEMVMEPTSIWCDVVYEEEIDGKCVWKEEYRNVWIERIEEVWLNLNNEENVEKIRKLIELLEKLWLREKLEILFELLNKDYSNLYEKYVKLFKWWGWEWSWGGSGNDKGDGGEKRKWSNQDKILSDKKLKSALKNTEYKWDVHEFKRDYWVDSKWDAFVTKDWQIYFKAKNNKWNFFEPVFTHIYIK